MNDDKGEIIFCSRCGAEVNSKSRYCMKCGNLNYDHDANENMRPYIPQESETYEVGSGKFAVHQKSNEYRISVGNNTGNKKVSFGLTLGIYLFILFLSFLLTVPITKISLDAFLMSSFPYLAILFSLLFLFVYGTELVFMKCNKPWWAGLIPVYHEMVLADIIFHNQMIGLLTLIPIVGPIVTLVLLYHLGKKFQYNGVLTALFPGIFILLIGYGSHLFEGYSFVSKDEGKNALEKEYKYRKTILATCFFIAIWSLGIVIYANMSNIEEVTKNINNYYYVYAAKRITSKTEKGVNNKKVGCGHDPFNPQNGVYYFYYADFQDYIFLPFYTMRDIIGGYVKVEIVNGKASYYVSLSDGTYGFKETKVENIEPSIINDFRKYDDDSNSKIICTIKDS